MHIIYKHIPIYTFGDSLLTGDSASVILPRASHARPHNSTLTWGRLGDGKVLGIGPYWTVGPLEL